MNTPATIDVRIGDMIAGKYLVERVLGAGGMGVVVAARHVDLGDLRAIKLMHPQQLGNAELLERFRREARVGSRLKSEHIVKVYDLGGFDVGPPHIIMEYLEGSDLGAVIKARGALPIGEAVFYVNQACDAIAAAHAAGIVHRDLKPANLFLTRHDNGSPCIKVLDFGISKLSTPNGTQPIGLTATSDVIGSPAYMAPEQARSLRDADERADIWALGVILFQLLTGRLPFSGSTAIEILTRILVQEPHSPFNFRPDLPPALGATILRCLVKDPAKRISNVAELRREISPFLGGAAPRGPMSSVDREAAHLATATTPQGPGMESMSSAETRYLADTGAPASEALTQRWQPSRPDGQSTGATAEPNPQTKWWLAAGAAAASIAAAILVIGRMSTQPEAGRAPGGPPATTEVAESAAPPATLRPPDTKATPERLIVGLDLPETFTVNDKISISITSNRRAFVALLSVDASGAGAVLLPNGNHEEPVSLPGSPLVFPSPAELRAGLSLIATLSPGRASSKEKFICMGVEDQGQHRALFKTLATKNGLLTPDQVSELLSRVQAIGGTVHEGSYEIIKRKR